jgi:uncharacterized coiled-coil protein SlyX
MREDDAMASLQTLERRIAALEARLADVEGGYGDTLYKLDRSAVQTRLDLRKILAQMNIEPTSDEEISAALDEE